jgi:hypothetical protein
MESDIKRRDFLKQGLLLAGTASVLASGLAPKAAFSQTQGKSVRRADRYEFVHLRGKPFKWPGNKTLAVWTFNVEVPDSPAGRLSQTSKHRAGRDQLCLAKYGMRVGSGHRRYLGRGVKATALNSAGGSPSKALKK